MTMYRTHTRRLLSLVAMLGCLFSSLTISHPIANATIKTTNNALPGEQFAAAKMDLSQRGLSFEVNQGQTDARVKFLSRGPGYTLFLTPTEAVLSLRQKQDQSPAIVRMKMIGANRNPEVTGEDKMRGKVNYFNGRDRASSSSQVETYARVNYREVYPGVDLVYYGKQQQLEYDFIVAPNQDSRKIRLGFSGVRGLSIDKTGALVLETDAGVIRQQPPVAYQEIDGRRQPVDAAYVLKKHGEVGFKVGDYDRSKTLVIDPIIDYSTYLGGSGQEESNDIAVDANGYLYVTGWTSSVNFPVKSAIKASLNGTVDAFFSVIAPSLTGANSLVSSTYWGQGSGYGNSEGRAITIDSNNHVLVAGITTAPNFPTTPGSLQATYQPFSGTNGFFTKFDLSTNTILYSTYLMGNNVDEAADLAVDHDNNVYIGGRTASTNFPVTLSNAYQISNAGIFDAFVMKLGRGPSPASPYSLRYSTYLGGFSDDGASNIAVDDNESVYLTGTTQSRDLAGTPQYDGFPVVGAYQSIHGGGDDAFLAKIDPLEAGYNSLVYSTYLGGNGSENAAVQLGGLALDPTTPGQVYVTGTTNSANFPLWNELDNTLGGYDVFVTKIDTSGSGNASLLYSTFLGGAGRDYGTDIAVDNWGRVFVAGGTESNDFPVKCGLANAPSWDGFITILEWGGSDILFSTYLGGDSIDQINAIAVDASGRAHVTGRTYSSTFPVVNGFQLTPAGSGDAFVTTVTPVKCE
jgi:Beta-propeller repeat